MGRLNKRQSGFAANQGFLIIAVVVLIGVVGYMVYKSHNKATINSTRSSATTPLTAAKQPEAPKLTDYNNDELGVSLNYPKEWGMATISDGSLLKFQTGKYKQLSFTKATHVSVDFVTGAYSSPLDACGYDDPVQNAQHELNSNKASVIGWSGTDIKRYMTGQGFNGPTVYLVNSKAGDTGPGWTQIMINNKVLVYKNTDSASSKIKAGTGDGCSPITQAQADEANAFSSFFHYAANFSNSKVYGVNAQFDARNGDDATVRSQLIDTLNSVQ